MSIYRTIGPLVRFTSFCCKNGSVSSKIYDKRDDFDFDIVNFPFLEGDVPRSVSYGLNICNLLGLLESAIMLRNSASKINV